MPTYQTIIVDITPGAKEKPVLNASQFDNGRPFAVALTWEGVSFTDAGDFDIEIHVKKLDGNIVTAEPDSVVNDVCLFHTTEQMCACHGNNECEIVLFDNDIQIGTGNFILDVEKAPDEGGIQSASDIANLASQVGAITLAYLVNNTDEIAEIIANKIYPTVEASGDIASFNTILQLPLVSVTADPLATEITRCGKNIYPTINSLQSLTTNGITFTRNNDGSISVEGTATSNAEFSLFGTMASENNAFSVKAGEYTISSTGLSASVGYIFGGGDGTSGLLYDDFRTNPKAKTVTINEGTTGHNVIRVNAGATVNTTVYIQWELGNQATAYELYNGITKPIDEATTIKTLTGVNNVFTDNGPVTVQYKYFPDI